MGIPVPCPRESENDFRSSPEPNALSTELVEFGVTDRRARSDQLSFRAEMGVISQDLDAGKGDRGTPRGKRSMRFERRFGPVGDD